MTVDNDGDAGRRDSPGVPANVEATKRELVTLLPRLRRFALSLTASREDADDLVQMALEKALRNLGQWQPGSRLDSWMFRIMQNLRIDQARAQKVRPTEVSLEHSPSVRDEFETTNATESRFTLEKVLVLMEKLPDAQRTILTLVCIEGMRYREAAEVLDISIGTVMSRLARARKNLYELLQTAGRPGLGEQA